MGVTETKITHLNKSADVPRIPGHFFEHAPTPLACGGVGLFIDETLDYIIPEATSLERKMKYDLWNRILTAHFTREFS